MLILNTKVDHEFIGIFVISDRKFLALCGGIHTYQQYLMTMTCTLTSVHLRLCVKVTCTHMNQMDEAFTISYGTDLMQSHTHMQDRTPHTTLLLQHLNLYMDPSLVTWITYKYLTHRQYCMRDNHPT